MNPSLPHELRAARAQPGQLPPVARVSAASTGNLHSRRLLRHKGGRTFGFRVSDGTGALAYFSDHHPLAIGPGPLGVGELHSAAVSLARNVDLLIHDAQYSADELAALAYLGHSCPEYVISLAEQAGGRRICLFHHATGSLRAR